MRISGTVCGLPFTWKGDTGERNTVITSETYKNISYSFRPGFKTSKKTFVAAKIGKYYIRLKQYTERVKDEQFYNKSVLDRNIAKI